MDCGQLDRDELVERYLRGELDSCAQDDFEIHILECAKCLRAVEIFQLVSDDLTQRSHEIRVWPPGSQVWLRWKWVAAGALSVLVFALGILQFGIYRSHHGPVILAERSWVLVSDFDTANNQAIPDAGLREGLTIALQQSRYINVYTRSRVYEALQRMKKADVSRVDEVLAQEICRRENVQVLLAGTVSPIGKAFQITVTALDPIRDKPLFVEKSQFDRREEFFDKVDLLARRVRTDLGESRPAIEKTSRPLANVTTRSLEALQLYSQAIDARGQGRMEQVPTLLQRALRLDPDFAMAHRLMAEFYAIIGNGAQELEHVKRAYELRHGLTERERRFIEAGYYSATGREDEAVAALTALVALYPEDPEAHRDLAFLYYELGDLHNSIQELHQVIKIDPNSAPAYANLVVWLARNNAPEDAMKIYQEANARGLASPGARWGLGMALWSQGRVAEAQAEFLSLQEASPVYESIGRFYFARTLIYQGKLAAASEQLVVGIRHDKAAKRKSAELVQRYLLADVALTEGKKDEARQQLELIVAAGEPEALQAADLQQAGALYAQMGDVATSRRILRRLEDLQAKLPNLYNRACRDNVAGEIALAEARSKDAVQLFSASLAAYPLALSHQGLARAYEAQRDWRNAATEWKKFLDSRGEVFQDYCPTDWVLAHLSLARVYRHFNDIDGARAEYKKFLEIWRESDRLRFVEQVVRESQEMEGLERSPRALGPRGGRIRSTRSIYEGADYSSAVLPALSLSGCDHRCNRRCSGRSYWRLSRPSRSQGTIISTSDRTPWKISSPDDLAGVHSITVVRTMQDAGVYFYRAL